MLRVIYFTKNLLRLLHAEYKFTTWKILQIFRKRVTLSTQQGRLTVFTRDEAIGLALYHRGKFELDWNQKAMSFLRSIQKCPPKGQGTILDIGSNNGVTSIGMIYQGEVSRAIAIEPEPQNFSLLQHNVQQNHFEDRFICLPYAVQHEAGEVLFELSDNNFGDHRVRNEATPVGEQVATTELFRESQRRVIKVQADRLDSLLTKVPPEFREDIAVVWVDVQGYEGYVFQGAKHLFAKGIPVVSELWPYTIKRAGMTQAEFCEIARSLWSHYWVLRRRVFVQYPIEHPDILFDELGDEDEFENIIFI